MQSSINDHASLLKVLVSYGKEIKNYGVEQLGIFGSFAKNEITENSDVDLLVQFNKKEKTYDNFLSFRIFFKAF